MFAINTRLAVCLSILSGMPGDRTIVTIPTFSIKIRPVLVYGLQLLETKLKLKAGKKQN